MRWIVYMLLLISATSYGQKADSTRKQFLGILTLTERYKDEKNWTTADQGVVAQHFNRLKQMSDQGIVILAGRTSYETNSPDMMGLVIFYAKNAADARKFMEDDPAVQNKIMVAKIHPYDVALIRCD